MGPAPEGVKATSGLPPHLEVAHPCPPAADRNRSSGRIRRSSDVTLSPRPALVEWSGPARTTPGREEASLETVLRVEGARKAYGAVEALRGAALEVRAGELVGLLGPNGAGKTTLVRAIAGLLKLDGGRVELFGRQLDGSGRRGDLGLVPQELAVYPLLTARENLLTFGRYQGVTGVALKERVEWALEWTALADRAREPVRRFSGGMRRRLNLACSVLHSPRLLLLDEPTVGVDPQSRERIYEMLEKLRQAGVSMLLTTHQLEEAEARCGRIVILDRGQVVAAGSLAELMALAGVAGRQVTLRLDRPAQRPLGPLTPSPEQPAILSGEVPDAGAGLAALLTLAEASGARIQDLEVRAPSLQSVFIRLTGRELRE